MGKKITEGAAVMACVATLMTATATATRLSMIRVKTSRSAARTVEKYAQYSSVSWLSSGGVDVVGGGVGGGFADDAVISSLPITPAFMYRYSVTPIAPTLVMRMIMYAKSPVKYRSTPIHTTGAPARRSPSRGTPPNPARSRRCSARHDRRGARDLVRDER